MKASERPAEGRPRQTIRVRLGLALAVALLPILILGAVQSTLTFRREGLAREAALQAAATRSAGNARARLESAEILLQTLAPGAVGLSCAQRLAEIARRIPGYANLIRFDRQGRVSCAAASVGADATRQASAWFQSLRGGASMRILRLPGQGPPSILAAVRAMDANGDFDGALAAVIDLRALRPSLADRDVPARTEVALVDTRGAYLTATRASAFPIFPPQVLARNIASTRSWTAVDPVGQERMFAVAPVTSGDVAVVLSAPRQGLFTWALLDPLSTVALPFLAFALALLAVWIVAERGVLRWIAYLQRIAGIYARGRFSVHPFQADEAPPEFRSLAASLDEMAETIAARDAALRENLAQKDAMMREIHHRVKNNLQVISSLLNMQQRALADPAARAAINDTRQRISALALIYRLLYQGPDLREVDLRDFLEELLAMLVTSEPTFGQMVETGLKADSLIVDADRLPPLALFAVEAITNARKHGISEQGGRLLVEFTAREGKASLSIADSGVEGHVPVVGQGVGRTLMIAFARQLRGEVSYSVNEMGGLTTLLQFPFDPEPTGATVVANRNPEQAQAL